MEGNIKLLLPVLVPMVMGVLVLSVKGLRQNRRMLTGIVTGTLAAGCILTFLALYEGGELAVWRLTRSITIGLSVDGVSRLFAALTCVVWLLAGIYSVSYMAHEKDEFRFFGFYLIVLGVLIGLDFSANLVTLYVFFEMMTLTSLPLVLHEMTREAVMAGLKYLFYSIAGAFLALFGIFFLAGTAVTLTFTPGGVAFKDTLAGNDFGFGLLCPPWFWHKSRHVSHARLAAHCPSRGAGAGQRRAVGPDYQGRGAGHTEGDVFYRGDAAA